MTRVIVAGSTNNFTFAVIDFTTPGSPGVVQVNPGYGGGSTVAINGSNAVAGNINGGQVRLVDVSNPAVPALKGMINTTLLGVGAIAIRGTQVAVGEQNGGHIALLDFSTPMSPTLVANKLTGSGAFSSMAFIADSIVVASGPNDFTATQVDFTNPASPVVTTFNPALSGSPSLDADATANHIAVGDTSGVNVKLIDGTSKAVLGTATTAINSVASVALAGSLVLAGGPNSFNVARINFAGGPVVTSFSPGYASGSVVAIDGTVGACGQIVSAGVTHVNLFDLTPTPPALLGSANSGIDSIVTLAMSSFTAGPPPTPAVAYSPLSLAFGAVRVGTISAPLPLTLHNAGGAALSITNIHSSSPFFTFSPAGPLTVAPAGNVVLQVRFAPNAEAPFSGNLTMQTNDPAHPTVTLPMSGTGGLPHISLSSGSLAFGDVAICLSKPLTLSIHNSGAVALTVSALGTGGPPFSVSPSNLAVGAGATLPMTVTYTPTALGPANAVLGITCDDPANAHPSVTLSGNGLPTPPPAVAVSPMSLNFGPTPLQYWIGLWVTVANTSPCQALSVDLATSGTPFFVTDGYPTAVPPTSVPVHQDIPGNASHKFAVIFSATTLGAASGVLTITSNDPANPTVTVPLTGSGVLLAPAALELVLDRSGSMAAAAPGGSKMDALKAAVHLFADLVIPGQGNEMGSVEFDDVFAPLTPPGAFDAAKQQAIEHDVDTLTPRFFTCIGGGLQLGQNQLGPSAASRKVILVFTDGLENRSPLVSSVESSIMSAGTEVYAIGLGQPQNISGAVLSELASSSQGHYFQTDDTLVLRKHFVQVLADAYRHNLVSDPMLTLQQGISVEVPVLITECERRISFILTWDDPLAQLEMDVRAPDGTLFTPTSPASNQLVRYGAQPTHRYYQIAFPPLNPGSGLSIGPDQLGQWIMRINPVNLPGGTGRCTTGVMVESDLELQAVVHAVDTSSPLQVEASILHQGTPVDNAQAVLTLTAPLKSLAQVSTPAVIQQALQADIHPIPTGRKPLIPTKTTRYQLHPAERGRCMLELPPPKLDGVYDFVIQATGKACGGTFERYKAFSLYIGGKPNDARTKITADRTGTHTANVTVTPRDARGKPLGSGRGALLQPAMRGARISPIRDNLDGSYTFQVVWDGRRKQPTMRLKIGDESVTVFL